jgi:PAT family beta-lactamase induction signal transducer AmpG
MSALLFLGFSSGLPLFLTSKTLQAWMTLEKVDLSTIGWFSLVTIPYSAKFIWSPLLDSFIPPFLGRRRGWLLITQIGLVLAIGAMSLQNPSKALLMLAINAFMLAFFSATQDIAADAYRTDILLPAERGTGVANFVLGYRLALIITGSLTFILADHLRWPQIYLLLMVLMMLISMISFWAPEPQFHSPPPTNLYQAIILPFLDFFQRQGQLKGFWILLFIVLYKLGDALVNNMSTPFLLISGFSQTDIGAINGGVGLIATIIGIILGGVLINRLGSNRSLWIFGALQSLSVLTYFVLSLMGKNYLWMILAVNIEHFCAGLGTAAFLSFLMGLCNPRFSATQYALLSSFMAFSRDILVGPSGMIVEHVGWPWFFILSFLVAIPGLLLLPIFAPWGKDSN